MTRHMGNPGRNRLDLEAVAEGGAITATKPKVRKRHIALYAAAGVAWFLVWFLFGREIWRVVG